MDRLRDARPDLALSSDFIVGHPGETDADHAKPPWRWCARVGFATAFSFKYSSRPGTPAAGAPGQVPEAVKDARLQELQAALRDSQAAFNADSGRPGRARARHRPRPPPRPDRRPHTPRLQPVHFSGSPHLIGQIVPVQIAADHTHIPLRRTCNRS